MAVAADALLWELNRLSFAIDRIQRSCQYQAKLNQDVSIAHDVRSIAREASAAPAASFKSRSGKSHWPRCPLFSWTQSQLTGYLLAISEGYRRRELLQQSRCSVAFCPLLGSILRDLG